MKFSQRRTEDLDINITPLIDIVFLLLIFFMVSTTFKQEFEVGIDLPQASSEQRLADKPIEISIDDQGRFAINQQVLVNTQAITLRRGLEKVAGEDRRKLIVISADANTPHQAVIRAMDVAQQLGFSRLSFATQSKTE